MNFAKHGERGGGGGGGGGDDGGENGMEDTSDVISCSFFTMKKIFIVVAIVSWYKDIFDPTAKGNARNLQSLNK